MVGLLTPAVVDQSARMPGGLLARSLPAPAGWERGGLIIPFYGCGEPVLRDKCITAEDVPTRNGVGEFPAVPIEQGSQCSTTGRDSVVAQSAADRYAATADWALSRQLQTDQAATGQPKLDDAVVLGVVAAGDFVTAMGCLEQAAADAGFGAAWVVHAPVRAAAYLADAKQMKDGLTATGAPVIIGSGYTMPSTTSVRLWVTGRVWASISTPDTIDNTAHRLNNDEAWAIGEGVAAFDPCLLFAIDVTVPACPTPA